MRKDVAPDPKHLDSVPDYAKLDSYFLAATDAGEGAMKKVQSLYSAVKEKGR